MMSGYVFQGRIGSWSEWSEIFQSIRLFQPLADRIMAQAGLPTGQLRHLTPGTHAVFAVDEFVIKIFAPLEAGQDCAADFANECSATGLAAAAGLPVVKIMAAGTVVDRYRFSYIIMSKMPGCPAADVWPGLSDERKQMLCGKMDNYLRKLRSIKAVLPYSDDLRSMPSRDLRWQSMHPSLTAEMNLLAQQVLDHSSDGMVLVHGDLTADNMLITEDDDWVFLDFADSKIAPACYELPPLVFDLYRSDPVCLKMLSSQWNQQSFIDTLIRSLAIHDFGGDAIRIYLHEHDVDLSSVSSIKQLRQILQDKMSL